MRKTVGLVILGILLISPLAVAYDDLDLCGEHQTALVEIIQDGQPYRVEYRYDPCSVMVPLTNPVGTPHYDAMITVYKVIEGNMIKVGQSFSGQYVEGGCFDADPYEHIKYAKEAK